MVREVMTLAERDQVLRCVLTALRDRNDVVLIAITRRATPRHAATAMITVLHFTAEGRRHCRPRTFGRDDRGQPMGGCVVAPSDGLYVRTVNVSDVQCDRAVNASDVL